MRERIRLLYYSRRTEEAYVHWVRATGRADEGRLAPVFRALDGEHRLFAQLLYGTGMRVTEGGAVRSLVDAMGG